MLSTFPQFYGSPYEYAKQKGDYSLLQLMSAAEERKGKVSVHCIVVFTHCSIAPDMFLIVYFVSFQESSFGLKLVKYEISQDDLHYENAIGRGASGMVYRGMWKHLEVALKKCDGVDPDRSEANIMRQLGQHPYVTALFGFCYTNLCTVIVMQFAEKGSLYEYLHKKGNKPSLQQSLTWAKQIAYAMTYLHERHFVHRDLKSANVLLTESMNVLLCDFGTTRRAEHTLEGTKGVGTYRWMAPEVLKGTVSKASDVYSFGMVLYELVEQKIPFCDDTEAMAAMKTSEGEQPPLTIILPEYVQIIIQTCWAHNPHNRPTFDKIVRAINLKSCDELFK